MAVQRKKSTRDRFTLKSSSLLLAAFLCMLVTLYHYHAIGRFRLPTGVRRHKMPSLPLPWSQRGAGNSADDNEDAPSAIDTVVPFHGYRPVWKRWHMHMFHQLDDDLVAEGNCVGWRQTGRCSPDGPVEPMHCLGCTARITSASGYCLCLHGVRTHKVGCGEWSFTCAEACNRHAASNAAEVADATAAPMGDARPTIASMRERGRDVTRRILVQRRLLAEIHHPSRGDGGDADALGIDDTPRAEGDFLTVEQRQEVERDIRRREKEAMWSRTKEEYSAWLRAYNEEVRRLPYEPPDRIAPAEATRLSAHRKRQSECRAWRSVQGCDPHNGLRQPSLDRACSAVIPDTASGYCDCGPSVAGVAVGCSHRPFTCAQACRRDFDMGLLIAPKRFPRDDEGNVQRGVAEETDAVDAPKPTVSTPRGSPIRPSIRQEVENRFVSSRAFGNAHLAAVRSATQDVAGTLHQDDGDKGGATHAIGASLSHILRVAKRSTESTQNGAARHRMPYRRPDVLEDTHGEQAFYKYLDGLVEEAATTKKSQERRSKEHLPLPMLPSSGAL